MGLLLCTSCLGGWKFMSISNTCLFEVLRFAPRIFCACNGNVATSGRPVFFCNLYCDFFAVEFSNYAKFHGTVLGCNNSKLAFWLNFEIRKNSCENLRMMGTPPGLKNLSSKGFKCRLGKAWESQTEIKTTMPPKTQKVLVVSVECLRFLPQKPCFLFGWVS